MFGEHFTVDFVALPGIAFCQVLISGLCTKYAMAPPGGINVALHYTNLWTVPSSSSFSPTIIQHVFQLARFGNRCQRFYYC